MLTTCPAGFMSCQSFLVKHSYSTILFSGLPEMKPMKGMVVAARNVVSKAQELIIVHNRDRMADLVSWFTKLTRLILYHDLMLQLDSSDEVQTLTMLLANCPSLSELQAPLHEAIMLTDRFQARSPFFPPVFDNCRELTLGSYLRRSTRSATMMGTTTLPCIKKAHKLYPNLEQLQVSTVDRNVLTFVPKFSRLKRLAIMAYFCLPLPVIVQTSECLSFLDCNLSDEAVQPGSFTKLRSLALSDCNMDKAFFTLLKDAEGLTNLHLDGGWGIALYIKGPAEPLQPRPIHREMEFLNLDTNWSLRALDVSPEELRSFIDSMPMLRRLSTDSYDIRLCMQNYYPHVKLTWPTCTTCMAEFPKVNLVQDYIWHSLHIDNNEDCEDT
ncbi:hypothetical protein MRX96_041083 [Rhipicephalus microplus]